MSHKKYFNFVLYSTVLTEGVSFRDIHQPHVNLSPNFGTSFPTINCTGSEVWPRRPIISDVLLEEPTINIVIVNDSLLDDVLLSLERTMVNCHDEVKLGAFRAENSFFFVLPQNSNPSFALDKIFNNKYIQKHHMVAALNFMENNGNQKLSPKKGMSFWRYNIFKNIVINSREPVQKDRAVESLFPHFDMNVSIFKNKYHEAW